MRPIISKIESQSLHWLALIGGSYFFITSSKYLLWGVLQAFVLRRMGGDSLALFYVLVALGSFLAYGIDHWLLRRLSTAGQGAFFVLVSLPASVLLLFWERAIGPEASYGWMFAFMLLGALIFNMCLTYASDKTRGVLTDVLSTTQLAQLEPIYYSIGTVGMVLIGVFMSVMGPQIDTSILFATVPLLILMAAIFYVLLTVRVRRQKAYVVTTAALTGPVRKPTEASDSSAGTIDVAHQQQAKRISSFVIVLVLIFGLSMVFGRIFNYKFILASGEQFSSEAAINGFIGQYYFILGVLNIIFVNSARKWMFKRFGLTNMLHIPTIILTLGLTALLFQTTFVMTIGLVLMRDVIMTIQDFSFSAMLQGVSDYTRNRAWALISGPTNGLAELLGSLLLLGFVPSFWGGAYATIWAISLVTLILLGFRALFIFRLRHVYPGVMLDSLSAGDFKTRLRAMEILNELRFIKDRRLDRVREIVSQDSEPAALRVTALNTLAGIGDLDSVQTIARVLNDSDRSVRLAAVRAIGSYNNFSTSDFETGFSRHDMIAVLRKSFGQDSDPDLIHETLNTLMTLRDPEIVPLLIDSLKSNSAIRRNSCLLSLARFHDPMVITHVEVFLGHSDPEARALAVVALWQFEWQRENKLEPVLHALVHSPFGSEEFRQGARATGRIGLMRYQERLRDAVVSDCRKTRIMTAAALLRMADTTGLPVLESVLRNGTEEEAEQVLRLTEDRQISPALQGELKQMEHRFHLHYPHALPVSEPLRRRLIDVPKDNLIKLKKYYQSIDGSDADQLQKIDWAIDNANGAAVVGKVTLIGLSEDWEGMAAVRLLASGYQVTFRRNLSELKKGERLIAGEAVRDLPKGAVVVGASDSKLPTGTILVQASHYSPSEIVRALEADS